MSSVKIDTETSSNSGYAVSNDKLKTAEVGARPDLSAIQLFDHKSEPTGPVAVIAAATTTNLERQRHDNIAGDGPGSVLGASVNLTPATKVTTSNAHIELTDHVLNMSTSTNKKKGQTGDPELDRFIMNHPDLASAAMQLAQEALQVKEAERSATKAGLSNPAIQAALERIAVELNNDLTAENVIFTGSVLDSFYKLVADKLVDPDKATEAVTELKKLALFDMQLRAEALAQNAAARSARAAKAAADSPTPAPVQTPKPDPRDDTIVRRVENAALATEAAAAAQKIEKERVRDQARLLEQTKQLEELSYLAQRVAKEKAKSTAESDPATLKLAIKELADAQLKVNEAERDRDSKTIEHDKIFFAAYVEQALLRAEVEQVVRKAYELAVHANVSKGSFRAVSDEADLKNYLDQNRAVLARIPGGETRLQEILQAAHEQAEQIRIKVDRATTDIANTSNDSTLVSILAGLSRNELYFVALQYQERTGTALSTGLHEKMSGSDLSSALTILSNRNHAVLAVYSLNLADLAEVNPDAVRAMLAPKTDVDRVVAIQERLKTGQITEAAVLLAEGRFTSASLASVEKANKLNSTVALIRSNYLLEGALQKLDGDVPLNADDVGLVGSYELFSMAEVLGSAQAASEIDESNLAQQKKELEDRQLSLAMLDARLGTPQFKEQLGKITDKARQDACLATIKKLSSDAVFFDQYQNDKIGQAFKQSRATGANNALAAYLAAHEEEFKSSPDFSELASKAQGDGKRLAMQRMKDVGPLFNLISGGKKGDEFLAELRQKVFDANNPQVIEDLRSIAAINHKTFEQIINDEFGVDSLKGRECRALLRGDRIDAAAAHMASLIKNDKSDELALLYSSIQHRGGEKAFEIIQKHFDREYANEITYQEFTASDATHVSNGHTARATSLAQALSVKFNHEEQLKLTAARNGDQLTIDAIELRKILRSNILSFSPTETAKYLGSFRDSVSELDAARIKATVARFSELYGRMDPQAVAALTGTDKRSGNDWAQLHAVVAADDAELRVQQTLSQNFDLMLEAVEKPQQLSYWEKIIKDPKALASLQFPPVEKDGKIIKSEEDVRAEFVTQIKAASTRWEHNRDVLDRRVREETHQSLREFHQAASLSWTTASVDVMKVDLLYAASTTGEISDAMKLWRNMKGAGTTSEKEILEIIKKAAADGKIEQLSSELRALSGQGLESWVFGDLSGDDLFWVELAIAGQPKTQADARLLVKKLNEYTESASWTQYVPELAANSSYQPSHLNQLLAGPSGVIDKGVASLMIMMSKDAIVEYVNAKQNAQRVLAGQGDGPMTAEQQAAYDRLQNATKTFLDRRIQYSETMVDGAATVVMIVGGSAIVICSGGVGAAVILVGATGVTRIAAKHVLMGDSYGREAVALDLAKSGVDLVTLGVSTKIPIGHFIQARTATLAGEAGLVAAAKATGGSATAVALDAAGNVLAKVVTNASENTIEQAALKTAGVVALEKSAQEGLQNTLRAAGTAAMEGTQVLGTRGTVNFVGTTGQGFFSSTGSILKNPVMWMKGEGSALVTGAKSILSNPGQALKNVALRSGDKLVRGGIGAVGGATDGAIAGGIQGFGYAAIEEQTWDDGFLSGIGRSFETGVSSAPMGAMFGGAFGAIMHATVTPRTVKLGEILSPEFTEAAFADPRINADGRALMLERASTKGFATRGDFFDAVAASKPASSRFANQALKEANVRLEAESAQATKDCNAAKSQLAKKGITPEEQVLSEQARDIAQTRLSEIELKRQELGQLTTDFQAGKLNISRYEAELWRSGQPQVQSTVVKKGWVEDRIAQEKATLEKINSSDNIDARAQARVESRLDGLKRIHETLEQQAQYLEARAKPVVDGAKALKERSLEAFNDLKQKIAAQEQPELVGNNPSTDQSSPVASDVPQSDLIAEVNLRGAKANAELPVPDTIEIPVKASAAADEISSQIANLKRQPQTPETKAELRQLYAKQRQAIKSEPVIDETSSRSDDGGDSIDFDDGYHGGDPDFGGGDDFGGGSGGNSTVTQIRPSVRSGGAPAARSQVNINFNTSEFGASNSARYGFETRNSGSSRTRAGSREVVDVDGAYLQSEASSPAVAVLEDPIAIAQESEPSTSDAAYHRIQRRYNLSPDHEPVEFYGADSRDSSVNTHKTLAERLADVSSNIEPAQDSAQLLQDLLNKPLRSSRAEQEISDFDALMKKEFVPGQSRSAVNSDVRQFNNVNESAEPSKASVTAQRPAVIEAEQVSGQTRQDEIDGPMPQAVQTQEISDSLQLSEGVPFDAVIQESDAGSPVLQALNRIFAPEHGHQTPRMHPLEEAALAVALMEPDPILDPRVSPQEALDPRVANQSSTKASARVRPMEELTPAYRLQPLPQPHKVKSLLETELENYPDEASRSRRLRLGSGSAFDELQRREEMEYFLPKHVVSIGKLEAKYSSSRSHGRRVLRRRKPGEIDTDNLDTDALSLEQEALWADRGALIGTDNDS